MERLKDLSTKIFCPVLQKSHPPKVCSNVLKASGGTRLPYGQLLRCERCDQADRRPVKRTKLAERDGRVAVALEVPMQESPARGERWLDWEVARRLEVMLNGMLAGDVEVATKHYQEGDLPAA